MPAYTKLSLSCAETMPLKPQGFYYGNLFFECKKRSEKLDVMSGLFLNESLLQSKLPETSCVQGCVLWIKWLVVLHLRFGQSSFTIGLHLTLLVDAVLHTDTLKYEKITKYSKLSCHNLLSPFTPRMITIIITIKMSF